MNDTTIAYDGTVTFWSCAKADRDKLVEVLTALGKGYEKFVPKQRTPAAALKAALEVIAKDKRSRLHNGAEDIVVMPLRDRTKNGFEVVKVKKGMRSNEYPQIFAAKVRASGLAIEVTTTSTGDRTGESPDLGFVTDLWNEEMATLPQHSVGAMFKQLASIKFDAVSLRPMGGLYWMPDGSKEDWEELCKAVESACGATVHNISHKMDIAALRAVKEGLTNEVEQECGRIADEALPDDIEDRLGERALESRKEEAIAVRNKIKRYEAILGETMDELTELAKLTERAAATAILQTL
jgi:hypothetical protein